MTTTEVPPRSPSPMNVSPNSEQPANTDLNKPVAASEPPVLSAATGGDHVPETSIVNHTSEPERAFQVADEQSRDDRPQTETPTSENLSPEAQSLKAMFPDIDGSIIEAVLQSVNGDQERAADVLLGMSDPNYVSQQPSARTQTELDEEFARRLVMEEQQQQANWHPDDPYPLAYDGRGNPNVPYQPRIHHGAHHGSPPQQQNQPQSDTMEQVQTQFKQFAETGKKTFSSLFSKVKAKVQEFDQSRNQSGSSQQASGIPSGSPPTSGPNTGGSGGAYSQQLAQPQPQSLAPSEAIRGYDTQAISAAGATSTGTSGPAPAASPPPGERVPPRPPSAGSVDPSKIGLLPKRPVSLLGSNPNSSQGQTQTHTGTGPGPTTHQNEDDEELDYVENPFEEARK